MKSEDIINILQNKKKEIQENIDKNFEYSLRNHCMISTREEVAKEKLIDELIEEVMNFRKGD